MQGQHERNAFNNYFSMGATSSSQGDSSSDTNAAMFAKYRGLEFRVWQASSKPNADEEKPPLELQLRPNFRDGFERYRYNLMIDVGNVYYNASADIWALAITFYSLLDPHSIMFHREWLLQAGVLEMRQVLLHEWFDFDNDACMPKFQKADLNNVLFRRLRLLEGADKEEEDEVRHMADCLADLMQQMMQWEPWKRQTAQQLTTHEFFTAYGKHFRNVNFRAIQPYDHELVPALVKYCILKSIVLFKKSQMDKEDWIWMSSSSVYEVFGEWGDGDVFHRTIYEKAIAMWQRLQWTVRDVEIPIVSLSIAILSIFSVFTDQQNWEATVNTLCETWGAVGRLDEEETASRLVFELTIKNAETIIDEDKVVGDDEVVEFDSNNCSAQSKSGQEPEGEKTDGKMGKEEEGKKEDAETKLLNPYRVVRFIISQIMIALDYQLYCF